ncbi:MAG: hypothetical protein L6R42_007957, partial [Xanthoria sp. 1 TBL-2021]
SADATRARVALFERVDEIYKDEKNILAARAKAEQRTNKKSAEYRSEFNAEEVLQRKTYFIPTEDGIFRETLKVQFQDWWATRNEVFKGIVQDKEPVFKAAQQLNKQKPKDQQEKVNADWVFHKQCICWEFLRFWLDDQSEKLRQKSELRNDDRYRRAEYVKFFTDSLFGIVVREPL